MLLKHTLEWRMFIGKSVTVAIASVVTNLVLPRCHGQRSYYHAGRDNVTVK